MPKHFSVEEANRTLPLVRRIVEDIVRQYRHWQELVRDFEIAASSSRADQPDERAELLQAEALACAAEIDVFIGELSSLGIAFKDFSIGLIDFPGTIDGRSVWLCWRLGEPTVQYWHELDAGFAGRQPVNVSTIANGSTPITEIS